MFSGDLTVLMVFYLEDLCYKIFLVTSDQKNKILDSLKVRMLDCNAQNSESSS